MYRAWFIAVCLFSLISSSPSPPAAKDAATSAAVRRGTELYRAASCGTCHTLAIADTRGAFGPTHDDLSATVQRHLEDGSYTGSAKTVQAYLRESIADPAAFIVPEYVGNRYLMPAYTDFTDEELDALVTLLALREAPERNLYVENSPNHCPVFRSRPGSAARGRRARV